MVSGSADPARKYTHETPLPMHHASTSARLSSLIVSAATRATVTPQNAVSQSSRWHGASARSSARSSTATRLIQAAEGDKRRRGLALAAVDDHGAGSVLDALQADRAEEPPAQSVPMGADHEQVGVARGVDQRFGGRVF